MLNIISDYKNANRITKMPTMVVYIILGGGGRRITNSSPTWAIRKLRETLSQNKKLMAGDIAQCEDPEFNSQYHHKKKKKSQLYPNSHLLEWL